MSAPLTPEKYWEQYSCLYPEGDYIHTDLEVMKKRYFLEYAQQTTAYREELDRIMKICGVEHVNGEGGAMVAVSFIMKERKELSAWKKEQIETFKPLLDYGQSPESGIPLGCSIVEYAVIALKSQKEKDERIKELEGAYRDMTEEARANFNFAQEKDARIAELEKKNTALMACLEVDNKKAIELSGKIGELEKDKEELNNQLSILSVTQSTAMIGIKNIQAERDQAFDLLATIDCADVNPDFYATIQRLINPKGS